MSPPAIRILGRNHVMDILEASKFESFEIIRNVYESFGRGEVVNPHSLFLVPNATEQARVIALPAAISSDPDSMGIKWIASFPQNVSRGLERASAIIVLNDPQTGFPIAIIEGAVISAWRTALSAALACAHLDCEKKARHLAVIGCGLIAEHTVRELKHQGWNFRKIAIFDSAPARAETFGEALKDDSNQINICKDASEAVRQGEVVVFATTAGAPWFDDLDALSHNPVVLHLSLRDLSPRIVYGSDNYVDDVEHASRARTSLQLSIKQYGDDAVAVTDMFTLLARSNLRKRACPAIFSPFGLGMLDIALSSFVLRKSKEAGIGQLLDDFFGTTSC